MMSKNIAKKKGPSIKVVIKKKDNTNEQLLKLNSEAKDQV